MNTNQSSIKPEVMNMTISPARPKLKFINTDYLNEISDGNPEFITVFLKTFKQETERSLGFLQQQLRNDDFIFMEKTAHTMKPSGVYIGSSTLTMLVSLLEKAARNVDRIEVGKLVPQIQKLVGNILKEIEEYLR